MALPGWMGSNGLTDSASSLAYTQLLNAMTGQGQMDPRNLAGVRAMRDFDARSLGATVASGPHRTAFDQRMALERAISEDSMKSEARARMMADLSTYGQTFQKGAIADFNFRQDMANSERDLKRAKRNSRKKKYGTLLKTMGAVVTAFNPVVGGAMMAAGEAAGAGGNVPARTPTDRRTAGVNPTEKTAQTEKAPVAPMDPVKSGLAPRAPDFTNVDPLTGRPRYTSSQPY